MSRQQQPLIRMGTILNWSGSPMKVLEINSRSAKCIILDSGTVVSVPLRNLESATVLPENPASRCDHPRHENPGLITPCPECIVRKRETNAN